MPRLPRYVLPGQPQHLIQRGNNREPIFAQAADFLFQQISIWHKFDTPSESPHLVSGLERLFHNYSGPSPKRSYVKTSVMRQQAWLLPAFS